VKIATCNVNSLRVRLPHVLDWLAQNQPDVLCLQETKLPDADFPGDDIKAAGYQTLSSGQRTYNGVAILSRVAGTDVVKELPGPEDPQRRVLGASFGSVRVLNVYIPNGQHVTSDKYEYKLQWLDRLVRQVKHELGRHEKFVLAGDFNIAPENEDVHDPELWAGQVLFSEPERDAFRNLLKCGLHDVFRKFPQDPDTFSWWDYRAAAFRRNRGLRIDHILCSEALYSACRSCVIDKSPRKLERPSDHAPVAADFK